MTSAYGGKAGDGRKGLERLTTVLPLEKRLEKIDEVVRIVPFENADDVATGQKLMNQVILEGRSWPFDKVFEDETSFRSYFLSDTAFTVKCKDEVVGCFYIKPNFPGRCAHICNGGFITAPAWRCKGIGRFMALAFLRFAKDLGYRASYFNLVFASNIPSVNLWNSLGFQRLATLPNCAFLRSLSDPNKEFLDSAYGYYFDLLSLPSDFDPLDPPPSS